jgi:pimeloyl-ACP methyl ester carboxylesterase
MNDQTASIRRRGLLKTGAALAVGGLVAAAGEGTAAAPQDPLRPIPIPDQVPATEGVAPVVDGTRLWYWDTGGSGAPVVLLHPASGSGESWPYQQPVLAKAGYRVIAYSRRGCYRSEAGPATAPAGSDDLHDLMDFLGLAKCHLVGVAAGGGVAVDYALSHPDRLHSLTVAASLVGVEDSDYARLVAPLRPPAFAGLPADFRELGPGYRVMNRDGVTKWLEIESRAVTTRVVQPNANNITWARLEAFTVPTLLVWGESDLYTPPAVQRVLASHWARAETFVIPESGHNGQWERPDVFNGALLRFLRKR